MTQQQEEFLTRFTAALKARRVAWRYHLEAIMADYPEALQGSLARHEYHLDQHIGEMATEAGKMEGAGRGVETPFRTAVIELIKKY